MFTTYSFLFIAGLIAWFMSTVVAGGAASLLLPIISHSLGPTYVAPVITVASLAVNPTRVFLFRRFINWPILRRMLLGSTIGVILGAWCFKSIPAHLLQVLTGLFLISTPLHPILAQKKYFPSLTLNGLFIISVFVGSFSTVIGATGPVYNPFLFQIGLNKESLIATKSLASLWLQIIKLIAYSAIGLSLGPIVWYVLFLGAGGMIGVFFANRILNKISSEKFKQIVYLYMPISGIIMVYQALR